MPRAGCQTPTSARASEDLPEPLGPITPSAVPAVEREADIVQHRALPGAAAATTVTPSA